MDVTVGPEDSHDMGKIRGAYKSGDVEASKQAHAQGYAEADVHSGAKSEFIKSITFGGLDGIITTFAVVAAGAGAELEARVIILLGCANLVSDGISMGLGDFFSEKAEAEGEEAERKRMVEIVSSYPSTALRVITEHFVTSKGFSRQHAETMLRRYAGYQGHFVDMIVSEERLPDKLEAAAEKAAPESSDDKAADTEEEAEEEEEDAIWKQGLITTAAFWAFGAIPVVAFAIASWFGATKMTCFVVDIVCTLLTLAGLGVVQAKITRESAVKKAGQMVLNGTLACTAGYLIAWFISSAVGEGDLCMGAGCRPPFIDNYRFNDAPWLSHDQPVPPPDGSDSVNWECSARSWSDVAMDDTDHIFHMRVNLFAGENGHFELAERPSQALPELEVRVGETYFFDQTHHTNWMHPLGFAYFPDGHHGQTWGGGGRAEVTDFDALKYRVNNRKAKRIESTDIMEYDTKAYESAFSHLKEDWLTEKHGVQLEITDDIAKQAAAQGGVIYYYSRFHSRTSGKIRIVGGSVAGPEPNGTQYTPPAVGSFDEVCGTYDTAPYNPALGLCATQGRLLCDVIDTPFERCMAALNCKMKTEMQVGSSGAHPVTTFYQQMIPHHANAINMARVLLKTTDLSSEPFVEGLMNDIICGQTAQIDGMRKRLGQLGQGLPEDAACNNLRAIYGAAGMDVPYSINR